MGSNFKDFKFLFNHHLNEITQYIEKLSEEQANKVDILNQSPMGKHANSDAMTPGYTPTGPETESSRSKSSSG